MIVAQVYPLGEEARHELDGTACWCVPILLCADCKVRWACIHGTDRKEIAVHREAS